MLEEQSEQLRLQTAKEVMYGNLDKNKVFPIDVETRLTNYAIFVERKAYYPELGEMVSLKTTRRFLQPPIEQWENTFREGKYFERFNGLVVTILHDPIKQQEIEGVEQTRTKKATTTQLRKLVGEAKSATDFAPKKRPAERKEDTK